MKHAIKILSRTTLCCLSFNAFASSPAFPTISEPTCDSAHPDLCLEGISLSVTAIDNLRFTSSRILGGRTGGADESEQKVTFIHQGQNGISAGENNGWALWGNTTASSISSDFTTINSGGKFLDFSYDASQNTYTTGIDFFMDSVVYGISVGYEKTSTDTFFNGGGAISKGFTVAPYFAYLLNDMISIDASAGYSTLDNEQNRIDPSNGGRLNANFDSTRLFVNTNINFSMKMDNAIVTGRAGLMHTQEDYDKYTEFPIASFGTTARSVKSKKVDLTQGLLGVEVTFTAGSPIESYVFANYVYDFSKDIGDNVGDGCCSPTLNTADDDALEFGLGFSYFGKNGFTSNIEFLTTATRQNYTNNTLMLTLRQSL